MYAFDLYSGAGGATAGLKAAGFHVRLAVEADKDAADSYRANHKEVELLDELIEKYSPADLLSKAGIKADELTLITACPPCQGFSSLGKSDPNDPRNDHVARVGAMVQALRPTAVLIENVPGLLQDKRSMILKTLLRSLDYGVADWILNANEFCVPQRRRRYVAIAVSGLSDSQITDPRDEYECDDWGRHAHFARDVFTELGEPNSLDSLHTVRELPHDILRRVRSIPANGGSRFSLPEDLQLACHQRLGTRSAGSIYGRMSWENPSPTMTTRCTTPSCGRYLHPEEHRPITLREAASFQTFPKDYQWKGGSQSVARQIGNAVPVRMALILGAHVKKLVALSLSRHEHDK